MGTGSFLVICVLIVPNANTKRWRLSPIDMRRTDKVQIIVGAVPEI
jgi:hypothetical protein